VLVEVDLVGSLERTEEECRRLLAELRWPDGICCPRCEGRAIGEIPARRRFYCRGCRHFFSLTSGTAFHNSHLPIWKWFLAIELLLDAEDGLPANELWQVLGGSYKTAWFAEHRIRAALSEAVGARAVPCAELDGSDRRIYERAIAGRYRQLALKYLAAYQAEARWRARQSGNAEALRETVLALLHAEPVSGACDRQSASCPQMAKELVSGRLHVIVMRPRATRA
jgi:transposase-like protein